MYIVSGVSSYGLRVFKHPPKLISYLGAALATVYT